MSKDKRSTWFKVFLHQKPLVDSVSDEAAGKALKAALGYFASAEIAVLDPLAFAVFSALKPGIDESMDDYKKSVEAGRTGGRKRWGSDTAPIAPYSPPIGQPTEAEAETEADTEGEAERVLADKPPRTRFSQPTVDEVNAYCLEKGYQIDPERFVSYYEANGWMIGRNKMKSWQAAVRNWAAKEKERPTKPVYESGIDRLARMYKEEFGDDKG